MEGCKRWHYSCLLLGCCYDSRQAKMDLSSYWVPRKMDASLHSIQCPLLQVLLLYLLKSFNQVEILDYFLRVQPFLTRRSMPTSSVVKKSIPGILQKKNYHLLPATGNIMGSLKTFWREFGKVKQTAHSLSLRNRKVPETGACKRMPQESLKMFILTSWTFCPMYVHWG